MDCVSWTTSFWSFVWPEIQEIDFLRARERERCFCERQIASCIHNLNIAASLLAAPWPNLNKSLAPFNPGRTVTRPFLFFPSENLPLRPWRASPERSANPFSALGSLSAELLHRQCRAAHFFRSFSKRSSRDLWRACWQRRAFSTVLLFQEVDFLPLFASGSSKKLFAKHSRPTSSSSLLHRVAAQREKKWTATARHSKQKDIWILAPVVLWLGWIKRCQR